MFYITFSVQKVEGCRPIARVSVDGGPAFRVYDGSVYKFQSGRARVLHIYQGTSKKARRYDAWTVTLSGKAGYCCNVSLFPLQSDPRKTGAPTFRHYENPVSLGYGRELEHAASTMSRGEADVHMRRYNLAAEEFGKQMRSASPVPLKRKKLVFLVPIGVIAGTVGGFSVSVGAFGLCGASMGVAVLAFVLYFLINREK